MPVQSITDEQFEKEVLLSKLPVLIDFYADWCGPCKAIAPMVEDLSNRYAGRLKVVKVDVDRNPYSAQAFRVQSIPTIAVLHDRRVVDMIVGAVDRKRLEQAVALVLGGEGAAPGTPQPLAPQEAAQLVATGRLIPVDLRSEADFTRVHLPNAVSAPQEELQLHAERLADLQAPLLTYARTSGGDEGRVASLAQAGLEIYTLTGGLLAWEAERLPVQKTRPRMLD